MGNNDVRKPSHIIPPLRLALRGHTLLTYPQYNKGMGFTPSERKAFGLEGRLPFNTNTFDEQLARAYDQVTERHAPIRKNTFLQSLKEQNWTLYYGLLKKHLRELTPIIYTPTEAEAIASYSHLFRRSEGLFLSFPDEDMMEAMFLDQTSGRDIDLVVVTDSEAILGIGDQGVGGIGISTAKAVIYTVIGGLDPSKSLCVVLDVGTDNEELLADPLYVGWKERRVRGEAYDRFVDKFVQLVRKYLPHCLLHFEDFGLSNAHRILKRYRDTHAVFNDDIQGTGAVTLACLMSAIRVSSLITPSSSPNAKPQTLADQRYIIFGAGSAGMGITVQLRDAMISDDGVSREEANAKFWLVDKEGLLHSALFEAQSAAEMEAARGIMEQRSEFIRPKSEGWGSHDPASTGIQNNGRVSLLEAVKKIRPTVLIGCSTAAGAFTKEVVEAMLHGLDEEDLERGITSGQRYPIIFPLSNPSRLVEAKPEDLLKWTNGRALIATGSPFENVKMEVNGREVEFVIGECNNALIYPALGFGAILSKSRCVTDTMLISGAKRLASLSPAIEVLSKSTDRKYNGASLLPDFGDAPAANFEIAIAVAEQAIKEGNSDLTYGTNESVEITLENMRGIAQERVWVPVYQEYIYDPEGVTE